MVSRASFLLSCDSRPPVPGAGHVQLSPQHSPLAKATPKSLAAHCGPCMSPPPTRGHGQAPSGTLKGSAQGTGVQELLFFLHLPSSAVYSVHGVASCFEEE